MMPVVYVTNMERAIAFYETLGLRVSVKQRNDIWTELALGDAILALHRVDTLPSGSGRIELTFLSEELDALSARLKAADVTFERDISDEAFGRSMAVRDPDGLYVQINEHDQALYT
jgi:catechol 2,3-dioxygenase-like lactoylglutathione lyase family enzyme